MKSRKALEIIKVGQESLKESQNLRKLISLRRKRVTKTGAGQALARYIKRYFRIIFQIHSRRRRLLILAPKPPEKKLLKDHTGNKNPASYRISIEEKVGGRGISPGINITPRVCSPAWYRASVRQGEIECQDRTHRSCQWQLERVRRRGTTTRIA